MTKPTTMVCQYCSVETAVPHASASECVAALQREANRLREQLRNPPPRQGLTKSNLAVFSTAPQSAHPPADARTDALFPRFARLALVSITSTLDAE